MAELRGREDLVLEVLVWAHWRLSRRRKRKAMKRREK
jgi:hypothetical protein